MSKLKRLLQGEMTKGMLRFGASSMFLSMANMLGGILVLRWIPPELMTAWQGTLLAQACCDFVKLGILNGMNREFPRELGAGNREAALEAVSVTAAWLRFGIGLGMAFFVVLGVVHWNDGWEWRLAAVAGALQWMMAYQISFIQATYRGDGDFDKLSRIQIADAIWGLLLIPLVAWFQFTGFCLKVLLQVSLTLFLLKRNAIVTINPRINFTSWKKLFLAGFPLFVASYLFLLGSNLERMFLYSEAGNSLGLYAPVAAVQAAVLVLPNSFGLYLYPRLSKTWGNSQNKDSIWLQSWHCAQVGVVIACLMAALGWLTLPFLTETFFPQYVEAVPAMKLSLLTGIFLAVRPMASSLPAMGAWRWHYGWVGVFLFSKLLLCWWLTSFCADSLWGVSMAAVIASFLGSLAIIGAVRRATSQSPLSS